MLKKISFLFIFTIFLAGCQSAVKPKKSWFNKLDQDTPTAKVNFLVDKSGAEGTYFHINYGSACIVDMDAEIIDLEEDFFGVVSVPYRDSFLDEKDKIQTVDVPANQKMAIVLNSSTTVPSGYRRTLKPTCQFALDWEPKQGKEYILVYSWESNGCRIGMKEVGKYGYKNIQDLKIYKYNRQNCVEFD